MSKSRSFGVLKNCVLTTVFSVPTEFEFRFRRPRRHCRFCWPDFDLIAAGEFTQLIPRLFQFYSPVLVPSVLAVECCASCYVICLTPLYEDGEGDLFLSRLLCPHKSVCHCTVFPTDVVPSLRCQVALVCFGLIIIWRRMCCFYFRRHSSAEYSQYHRLAPDYNMMMAALSLSLSFARLLTLWDSSAYSSRLC